MSDDDTLRSDMIEKLMCSFELDLAEIAAEHGLPLSTIQKMVQPMIDQFHDQMIVKNNVIRLNEHARLIARLCAQKIDAYQMPEGRHSRAL